MMKYNKDQWISSFEDAMVKLRPHMSARVLTTIGIMAWNRYGKNDVDPKKAAGEWSTSMDKPPQQSDRNLRPVRLHRRPALSLPLPT